MPIEIDKREAIITNINCRKENGEGSVTAIDVKFSLKIGVEIMQSLVGEKNSVYSWMHNKDGEPKFKTLGAIAFNSEFRRHELIISDISFMDVKLNKFKVFPAQDRCVLLDFSVTVHPEGNQTSLLAEFNKDKVIISVTPPPELPLED